MIAAFSALCCAAWYFWTEGSRTKAVATFVVGTAVLMGL